MRVWIVAACSRATRTSSVAVLSAASTCERLALVVCTFVLRTSRSCCDPAPSATSRFDRWASMVARSISLFCLVMAASAAASFSWAAATLALAAASSASSVDVSIRTSTCAGFTTAPSSTRISFTRSGSLAAMSTSFPSMRPFPDTIPSGKALCRLTR
jgi:hypothetical protein